MSIPSPHYHVSIDDVFDALIDASDRDPSLREPPLFRALAALHEAYGMPVDLYVFAEGEVDGAVRRLEEIGVQLGDALAMPWLRFGPHALRYDTPPHAQSVQEQWETLARIFRELDRIAPCSPRSRWVRLHYFSECYELAPWLKAQGIDTLLLTDKDVGAYRLEEEARAALLRNGSIEHAGLTLRRSDVRIERWLEAMPSVQTWMPMIDRLLERNGCVTIFTHEVEMARQDVSDALHKCLEHLQRAGAMPV